VADALFDTTFFIDLRRGDPDARRLWNLVEADVMTAPYSVITVFELWISRGITRSEEILYEGALRVLERAELSNGAAIQAAVWVKEIPATVPEAISRDAMIAATAYERGEPVYTRNVRDMQRFGARVVAY
jgi:predicted nucleic acid-binding protein